MFVAPDLHPQQWMVWGREEDDLESSPLWNADADGVISNVTIGAGVMQ